MLIAQAWRSRAFDALPTCGHGVPCARQPPAAKHSRSCSLRAMTDAALILDATIDDRLPDRQRDFSSFVPVVAASPRDVGTLEGLIIRPAPERRILVDEAVLDLEVGVVGDDWLTRGSSSTPDGKANPETQLTLMSVRVLEAIEPDRSRWALAGDQLLVDYDLSIAHLPPGAHLLVGETELVVSAKVHTPCAKLSARFGSDVLRWMITSEGQALRFRGLNARVVRGGTIRVGDEIRKA